MKKVKALASLEEIELEELRQINRNLVINNELLTQMLAVLNKEKPPKPKKK